MDDKDCVLFVRDKHGDITAGYDGGMYPHGGGLEESLYRRVHLDLSAAVGHIRTLFCKIATIRMDLLPNDDAILSAILGAEEPEIEPEMRDVDAARNWLIENFGAGWTRKIDDLARVIARARAAAGKP